MGNRNEKILSEEELHDDSTSVPSSNDKNPTLKIDFSERIFHELPADTTVILKDGKHLKFCKKMLCSETNNPVLFQMFYGELQVETTKIEDIDHDNFKLFLDCVMGYKTISDHFLQIFPILDKYLMEDTIDQCLKDLQLTMDEKICEILNLATFYRHPKFIDKITKFISSHYNIYKFFENENYLHLLSPDSVKTILSLVTLDSYLLNRLVSWGKNYLKEENDTELTLRSFFEKHDVLKFFKFECFETLSSLIEFYHSENGIFSPHDLLVHMYKSNPSAQEKGEWRKIEKNEVVIDEVECPTDVGTEENVPLSLEKSKVVYYENCENAKKIQLLIRFFQDETDPYDVGPFILENLNRYSYALSKLKTDLIATNIRIVVQFQWTFLYECRVFLTKQPTGVCFSKNFPNWKIMHYKMNGGLNELIPMDDTNDGAPSRFFGELI